MTVLLLLQLKPPHKAPHPSCSVRVPPAGTERKGPIASFTLSAATRSAKGPRTRRCSEVGTSRRPREHLRSDPDRNS